MFWLKIPGFICTNTAGKYHGLLLKISSGFTHTDRKNTILNSGLWLDSPAWLNGATGENKCGNVIVCKTLFTHTLLFTKTSKITSYDFVWVTLVRSLNHGGQQSAADTSASHAAAECSLNTPTLSSEVKNKQPNPTQRHRGNTLQPVLWSQPPQQNHCDYTQYRNLRSSLFTRCVSPLGGD